MPRVVYILLLLIVACCRVGSLAAPFLQDSSKIVLLWQDRECSNEESEVEKAKQEPKEDVWLAQIVLTGHSTPVPGFIAYSDNRLLEHTRKPLSPPPDVA